MQPPSSTQPIDQPARASDENGTPSGELLADFSTATSLGERLIPPLLLAGEACVLYAVLLGLAIVGQVAGDANALLPSWGLLLIMLSFYALARLFQKPARHWITRVLKVIAWALVNPAFTLVFVWLNNYAQYSSFFSPDWVRSLLTTFIPLQTGSLRLGPAAAQMNSNAAAQAAVLLLLTIFCSWRGYRLASMYLTSTNIDRLLKWGGVGIMFIDGLFAFLSRAGETALSPLEPVLVTAGFCLCVLAARALFHASYTRRFHSAGLWGSAARQERTILQSMGFLVLVIAGIVAWLGFVYGWAGNSLVPASPYHPSHPRRLLSPCDKGAVACNNSLQIPPHTANPLAQILAFIAACLLLFLLLFLGWKFALPRWRKWWRDRVNRKAEKQQAANPADFSGGDETRESLWSWSLFLAQLKAFLLALLTRAKGQRGGGNGEQQKFDDIRLAEPAARSIREIYRALLKEAARRGRAREQDETPYEFGLRLNGEETLNGPQLETITEAYVQARYSGSQPAEEEIGRVKTAWNEIKQRITHSAGNKHVAGTT